MENQTVSRETIFALASAQGRAGVAIIRMSGPDSARILKQLTKAKLPKPRLASVRKLYDAQGEKIDEALILRFVGPASFTGEDMVEFHIHGGPSLVESLSEALFTAGLRQAEAGEFTKRAFQNGKMDLTEAEGLADLIDADTQGQRKQALRQMQGGLREIYENWREKIIDSLAFVEGEIDFPDEDDVPDALSQRAGPALALLAQELEAILADSQRGERTRHGVDIAIIGAPNAGKSSILNRLAKRDAAIVSAEAGTTRDIVEVHMEIASIPVRISDTAGLRETKNEIEAEGVRRAKVRAAESDLRIAIIDHQDPQGLDVLSELQDGDFIVYNKADLSEEPSNAPESQNVSRETFFVSAHTQQGLGVLESALKRTITARFGANEQVGITRARHVNCVKTALFSIKKAQKALLIAPELAGADLHQALHAIKELAGETDIEAVLDKVFSSFCIGK
ncbi:MAG: tRNA uridine-5-carboxymethylaminomethyl(34) synthesis GTPase MnmE [Robiginitomaculum sp.]|nr:MAG: tRNA uridine-5-carboxymethylaminomethyl(34) synthesis GTPase MnmE [Robiginitomaculum sp.]